MSHRNEASEILWWIANLLLSLVAIAIAYLDGIVVSIFFWFVGFAILMMVRPQ